MSRFRPRSLVAGTALCLALTACATPDPAEPAATSASAATPSPQPSPSATAAGRATPEPSEPAATAEVQMTGGSRFEPEQLTIAAGTEVTFVNLDPFAHTVTEGSGGRAVDDPVVDEEIDGGESADIRFDEPGTFQITCRIHPTMEMTIVVEA